MKSAILSAILLGAILGLGGRLALKSQAGTTPSANEPNAPSSLAELVEADGLTEGATPDIALRPELHGTLASLRVAEGQDVKAGDLLAEVNPHTMLSKVSCAKSEVALAKAQLAQVKSGVHPDEVKKLEAEARRLHSLYLQAKDKYDRSHRLAQRGAANSEDASALRFAMEGAEHAWRYGQAQHDQARNSPREVDVKVAEQKVAAAEAALKVAEAELARTRVYAPCDGRVLQKYAEVGELAGPNTQRPILVMADVSKRRVRAFVEEHFAARVEAGMAATVKADNLPGKEFKGTVAVVVPRMGKRALNTDAPGEYKDTYVREVLIDLEDGGDLPLNLRVHATLKAPPTTVPAAVATK